VSGELVNGHREGVGVLLVLQALDRPEGDVELFPNGFALPLGKLPQLLFDVGQIAEHSGKSSPENGTWQALRWDKYKKLTCRYGR
jgi:hypothetical protein